MPNTDHPFAFTGHRDLRSSDKPIIHEKLRHQFEKLGVQSLLVGNAVGADQIARSVASELNITVIDLNEVAHDRHYGLQAEYIAERSDHIIAVWDGVFTGKTGGTSDVIRRALHNGKRTIQIHHLVCPRERNPYPVSSLLDRVIDFERGKFSRVPFAISFSWIHHTVTPEASYPNKARFWNDNFRKSFGIPGVFAILTLVLGFWGFSDNHPGDTTNNFFRAVNLITLGSSVIEGKAAGVLLHLARFTGFVTATSALGFALYAALAGRRRKWKLKRWAGKDDFVLVLGLNQKSLNLITDLSLHHHKKVAVLCPDADNVLLNDVKSLPNVIAIQGNLYSGTMLRSVHAESANKIFIVGDTDTENIRALQELNVLCCTDEPKGSKNDPQPTEWFVHLEDESKRRFLHDSLSTEGRSKTNIFNVYENTVRRLLLYHPIDRFYQNAKVKHATAVIIGFGKLGKQLSLSLLKQGHYSRDKYLHILVYCSDASATEARFLKEYPQFSKSAYGKSGNSLVVADYTWSNIELRFEELPASDVEWLCNDNTLFSAIGPDTILNLYACLEDGIQSAAQVNMLLPKLSCLKDEYRADVQVFCYYNFPDKKEETIVEAHFNALAPYVFVKCFGNYIDECSASCIQDLSLDALPKLINAAYHKNYADANRLWKEESEKNKQSNRQAADHLWTKIRLVWPKIDWRFDARTFEPYPEVSDVIFSEQFLSEYGEIEHRRWCADLLLQGFMPYDYAYNSPDYLNTAQRWDKDKFFRIQQQAQKMHISLVPYLHLTRNNQQKDIDQIREIAVFLRGIVDTSAG